MTGSDICLLCNIGGDFIKKQGLWNKTVNNVDEFLMHSRPFCQKTEVLKERLWNPLKRLLLIGILLVCFSCFVYAGYERITAPKKFSIFGTVQAVETDENGQIILTVPYGETVFQDSSLRVHIDQKTRVYNLYPEKERINADEIRVGDVVEGIFRKGSEGRHDVMAKEICVVTKASSMVQ